ncbi:trypsin 3A1 [Stomoxys calcitrans]|uniref:Acrosin n=1 Tax=Stomoxys calcitrans TaxID=35570 RepID=A0A1I8QBP4_STOCA|nr:trypsin 3A1 [Stomoxys calcitrans]
MPSSYTTSSFAKVLLPLALLGFSTCVIAGQTNPSDERIVGGWETSITYFPHQVSLQVVNRHICGGSIIAEDLVLTAAHCIGQVTNTEYYTVRAGSSFHFIGGIVAQVKAIVLHNNYNHTKNDIALVKLLKPLEFNAYIQPIRLLEENVTIEKDQDLWVTGWGNQQSYIDQTSPILRYTFVHKISKEKCYKSYKFMTEIDENMFCAGVEKGGRDSCQGDSGGPLITRSANDNSLRLVGVVSFGKGCAEANYPGVYTRVQMYHQWLNSTIETFK